MDEVACEANKRKEGGKKQTSNENGWVENLVHVLNVMSTQTHTQTTHTCQLQLHNAIKPIGTAPAPIRIVCTV